ncbi:MAG TPA: hypothetical protein VLV78_19775 [Thermoanaerobaculia bacterium]|nr:hypothetical protein [Thermoanaerobaculia bacterium]
MIKLGLLTTFLITATAFAQCDYKPQFSAPFRASILDLSIDNNDLWAATGYGVQLFDRSTDPPRLVASIGIPGLTSVVRASNGTAYAGGTNGVAVVRRTGSTLQIARVIPLGAVSDLLLRPTALFAATATGVVEIDPLTFEPSLATFPTSNPGASALAAAGSLLYVADGDGTVEVFSIAVPNSPQKSGTIATLARASALEVAGSRLYVSDGLRTEVFNGAGSALTSLGTFPYPGRSLADMGSNIVFVAGADRQLRAIDATLPLNYIELFDAELIPSAGTINRVTALQTAGGRLYVGGGDTGLTTYDVSGFHAPFPLRSFGIGAASSVVALPTAFYEGRVGGGIQEMTRQASGNLVVARQWDTTETSIVQDGATGFLLTSSAATLTLWTLNSTIPVPISSALFRTGFSSAVLNGTTATALLSDGTLWTADMSQQTATPVRVASSSGPLTLLAQSDRGKAAVESTGDSTIVHYWSGTDLNAAPVNVTVPGVATALALNGSTAAVFTFRGVTLIDFASSSQTVVPGSNSSIVSALQIANGKVIALAEQSTVRIWDIASGRLEREFVVPGDIAAIDTNPDLTVAAVATSLGIASVDYTSATAQPSVLARIGGNAYYKKAAAGRGRLYLFDGRIVDVYDVATSNAPRWISSISAPGTIDIAASDFMLFTLSSSDVVTEYSSEGAQLRSKALDEGTDVTPIAVAAAAGAPWVSFSRGCTTATGCEKRTVVLDPQSLVRSASINGGIVDVATSGTRAYALFDLPAEIRTYDLTDPLHPAALATRANDAGAVSIAATPGTIYALGDKVYTFNETTLTKTGEQLGARTPATNAHMLIDSGCAAITGRSAAVETYAVPQWAAGDPIAVPGTIRSMTLSSGRLLILTDYSLEIWSRGPKPVPHKRRALP